MVNFRNSALLSLCSLGLLYASEANGQFVTYTYDWDPLANAQVRKNKKAQLKREKAHNEELEKVLTEQIQMLTFSSLTYEQNKAHRESMRDASGFGESTDIYKGVVFSSTSLARALASVRKFLKDAHFTEKQELLDNCSSIEMLAVSLVSDYINIVTNGTAAHPFGGEVKTDGYNSIDRSKRLEMARSIYTRLDRLANSAWKLADRADIAVHLDFFRPITWADLTKNNSANAAKVIQAWHNK